MSTTPTPSQSSRWGPSKVNVNIGDDSGESVSNSRSSPNGDVITSTTTTTPNIIAQHHSDFAASNDFELIDEVEWGPRRDEDGYDTDQELAPKPRRKAAGEDLCGCFPPAISGYACVDESCILYACREECRSNCLAGSLCGNKRIQRKEFSNVEVFDAGVKGKGLRLSNDAQPAVKGDIMCEYLGRAIREKALARLFRRYQLDRRLYIMALGDGVYLDARQKGGIARYINHSCRPNCKVELWTVRGVVRAAVVALCNISPGEELTFDYQWERRRGRAPTVCRCGMPECRGTLEVSKSLEEQDFQREFEGHWEQIPQGQCADQTFVNRTVQIYSKEHKEYFLGEVTGYDAEKRLHCIFYRQTMTEVWEDLSQEDWMILNEKVDKEHFTIAKKVALRRDINPTTPLLTTTSAELLAQGQPGQLSKNYLYVQTPIKETLWSMHLIERCERSCAVQIAAERMSRPPIPPENVEDTEKYLMLDQSLDGTVWKLTITGTEIPKAYGILRKNVAYVEKKLATDEVSRTTSPSPQVLINKLDAESSPSASTHAIHEVVFPRLIADVVNRQLQIVRDKCRNVAFTYNVSHGTSANVSKLSMEATILSDIEMAKEHLWKILLDACSECNAPVKSNRIYHNIGFLGGVITCDQYALLLSESTNTYCSTIAATATLKDNGTNEFLKSLPFIESFENKYTCSILLQVHEDKGRTEGDVAGESLVTESVNVYFGCKPSEVPRLWGAIQSHIDELARGVKFYHMGIDKAFMLLMIKNGGKLFPLVKHITGATVSVDPMTGDHLKIEGIEMKSENASTSNGSKPSSADQQAYLAIELVRLQVECYRDECIREQSWFFGRDWTIPIVAYEDIVGSTTKTVVSAKLDRRTASQCGMEIAETIHKLNLEACVGGHATTILFRFVYAQAELCTELKTREAVLACIFLANKAQKRVKWKRLDAILHHGYESLYPGASFDKTSEEALQLQERVLAAEEEILQQLQYDIFWSDVEAIRIAAVGGGKMKQDFVQAAFDFVFSGPVLGSSAELWLRFGVEYIFAASAGLLKANLDLLVPALALDPVKVSSAAKLIVESAKYASPPNDKLPSNPLLESLAGKKKLLQYLSLIEKKCSEIISLGKPMKLNSDATAAEKRFRLIGNDNRRCHVIRGIDKTIVKKSILPLVKSIEVESNCRIYVCNDSTTLVESLLLFGSWRSIALADHLLRSQVEDMEALPPTLDISTKPIERPQEPSKLHTGLLSLDDVCKDRGWNGETQADSTEGETLHRRVGGKYCIPGTISGSSLQKAGLGWWYFSEFGLSPSGSIPDLFTIRTDPDNQKENLFDLAQSMAIDCNKFRILTSVASKKSGISRQKFKSISLQRWPPEKIESKEKRNKSNSTPIGFSVAALQEMQILKQVHGVIPSPLGHPNFMVPIGVATPASHGDHSVTNGSRLNASNTQKTDLLLDDPILSILHSNDEKRVETNSKQQHDSSYLVFAQVPFILQRFISRTMRSADQEQMVTDTVLAAWFHDILSALVHCHENHILLRNILPDQIFIDHSGVAMIGSLYSCTIIPVNERTTFKDPLDSARSLKDRKKKESDNDDKENPYSAPEILLGCPNHSKASDVWAIGSLLASLLVNKPIFGGKDRESLLLSQYKVVGAPSSDNYEDAKEYPYYVKPAKKYKRGVDKALEHILKDPSPLQRKAIDLISKMLHLDPKKRCTAVEALGHEYMSDYVENCQSDTFREQFAVDWIKLKHRFVQPSSEESHRIDVEKRARKRNAMIQSVLTVGTGNGDDDLYNMDDFLDRSSPSSSKKSKSE